jgi:Rap1a immunity proteins
MRSIICAALLALAITAAGAVEDPINTSPYVTTAILDDCDALADGRGGESIFYGVLCRGIISGLAYGAEYGHCLAFPRGVTREQAIRVVVLYIKARPNRMTERFESLAIEALRSIWPGRAC